MRIAYITYEYPPDIAQGGIGTYITQVGKLMSELGHEVCVFCGSLHRTIVEEEGQVTVVRVQTSDPFNFRKEIAIAFDKHHIENPFDVIESAEINGNAWDIKELHSSIPMVVRLHAPNHLVESLKKKYVPLKNKIRFFLGALFRGKWDLGYWRSYNYIIDADREFTLLADLITAPSEAMKQWAIDHWKLSSEKISVIPNPFYPDEILMKDKGDFSTKNILFFGRLNVLKGLVGLSFALKRILKKHNNWKATIIGNDGPSPDINLSMKQWMQRVLRRVLTQVNFTNGLSYPQLMQQISESDIVVLPSLFESFSYSCAEAMAAGKAIVGSKIGGMADLLDNGNAGLLIDPYKANEIAASIEFFIMNETERKLYGERAGQRINFVCNNSKIGRQIEENYLSLLHN